jgi:starch phosphorylase
MWHSLYPDVPVEKVPIGHITNGIHLLGWMKGPVRRFWRRKFSEETGGDKRGGGGGTTRFWRKDPGRDWAQRLTSPEFWEQLEDPDFVSDEELWALRYTLRREMIEFCRRRLLLQEQRVTQRDFIIFDHLLNPDALTIGFARRFATYKRAPLIFKRIDDIIRLCRDANHPVQFIFAGKAHPRDDEGKRFIQKIIHLSKYSDLKGHLVFIENYDIHVARQMVSGCDIWMNNPRRPLEASGTSGMKASSHGCMNMSILDGWWREGYNGSNGFAVGDDSHPASVEEQDHIDSENLFTCLTQEVVPLFYDRDEQGIPREWIKRMRHTMATLVMQFTTDRMVKEYTTNYYVPGSK